MLGNYCDAWKPSQTHHTTITKKTKNSSAIIFHFLIPLTPNYLIGSIWCVTTVFIIAGNGNSLSLLCVIVFVCSLYNLIDLNPFRSFPPGQQPGASQDGLPDKLLSRFWHWKLWSVEFIALILGFNASLELFFFIGLSPVCITELIFYIATKNKNLTGH